MIIKKDKGNYYIVRSDCGKHIRVKGDKHEYSESNRIKKRTERI